MRVASSLWSVVSKTLALSAMLFAVCFYAQAQQPKKITRIGYLVAADPATDSARSEAVRVALRELGYVEVKTLSSIIDMLRANAIATRSW